ncbi:hypothetical protein Cni_G06246 [Canna indica]|uniref:Uncharacterized protein n=1 Tax=Canna indica TaxID=4628 RepID=A0AAQ3Q4K5_9LILI|nr:hypothetical protein Cni_G06246 [Canna indica]
MMDMYFKRKYILEGRLSSLANKKVNAKIKEENRSSKKLYDVDLANLSTDSGLYHPISDYHPNVQDYVRRAYLQKKLYQPCDYEFPQTLQELKEANNTLSTNEQTKLNSLSNKAIALQRQISMKWWAKAKLKWYLEGDKNTVYFHRMVTSRRRINHISLITLENGNTVTDENEILKEFSDFYKNLWSPSYQNNFTIQLWPIYPTINSNFNQTLIAPFSKTEI